MATKRQKGNKHELEVEKALQGQGYYCHRARASLIRTKGKIFCMSNDIFGCFDIIAKKQGFPMRLVQVSTGSRKAEKEKKILALDIWDGCDVEIWLRYPKGRWKIYRLLEGKFKECINE